MQTSEPMDQLESHEKQIANLQDRKDNMQETFSHKEPPQD